MKKRKILLTALALTFVFASTNNINLIKADTYNTEYSIKAAGNVSGVCKANDGNWYYYKNGKIQTGSETVQQNINGWWYIGTDGKVDFNKNTVAKNDYGWWVIQNGKVNFNYNGLASNNYGTWYCQKGKVNFNANGVLNTPQGWYYIKNGKVQTGSETVQKNSNGWWYIGTDGKVDFNKNTVAKNDYGWWVIQNGKVNFNYNGLASNKYGTWYCKNGKVDFNCNITNYTDPVSSKKYNITNGKATEIKSDISLPSGYTAIGDGFAYGDLTNITSNEDGTYTATWSSINIGTPIHITREQYNNIKLGTTMDFGTGRFKNYHCVKITDAYYFVPQYLNSVGDAENNDEETICIYKNNNDQLIRVYSNLPTETDYYEPAHDFTLVKNAKTIITQDATIQMLKTLDTHSNYQSFSSFVNSNQRSIQNRSETWRGTSIIDVYADNYGRIIRLVERPFCG